MREAVAWIYWFLSRGLDEEGQDDLDSKLGDELATQRTQKRRMTTVLAAGGEVG